MLSARKTAREISSDTSNRVTPPVSKSIKLLRISSEAEPATTAWERKDENQEGDFAIGLDPWS